HRCIGRSRCRDFGHGLPAEVDPSHAVFSTTTCETRGITISSTTIKDVASYSSVIRRDLSFSMNSFGKRSMARPCSHEWSRRFCSVRRLGCLVERTLEVHTKKSLSAIPHRKQGALSPTYRFVRRFHPRPTLGSAKSPTLI